LLGQGGTLSGLSAITRCPRTIATDGHNRSPSNVASDRFCLDGQRLVAVRGEYGRDGTEYRTERYSATRIFSRGAVGNGASAGPRHFVVESADGSKAFFGFHDDSRQLTTGTETPFVWWVSLGEDVNGNRIRYRYRIEQSTGPDGKAWWQHLPVRIDYGHNTVRGTSSDLRVDFTYEDRPDKRYSTVRGLRLSATRRLARVRSTVGQQLFREYRLGYRTEPVSGLSQINSITECAETNLCLRPTRLGWAEPETRWMVSTNKLPRRLVLDDGRQRGELIDINNDGFVDMLIGERTSTGNDFREAWLGSEAGFVSASQWTPPAVFFHNDVGDRSVSTARLVDLDGDGLVDLLQSYWRAGEDHVQRAWLNTGTGWQEAPEYVAPDVFVTIAATGGVREHAALVDLNADGRPDVVTASRFSADWTKRNVWLNNGAGFVASTRLMPAFDQVTYNGDYLAERTGRYIDVSGDGLVDYVMAVRSKNGVVTRRTYVNTGSDFVLRDSLTPPGVLLDYQKRRDGLENASLIDVNGDGFADFVTSYVESGDVHQKTWLNLGGMGWERAPSYDTPHAITVARNDSGISRAQIADVSGDGLVDLVYSFVNEAGNESDDIFVNTGSGWEYRQDLKTPIALNGTTDSGDARLRATLIDANGDGHLDIMSVSGIRQYFPGGDGYQPPRAVIEVTNGFGMRHMVRYAPISHGSFYEKPTRSRWPVAQLPTRGQVVKVVSTSDGVGGMLTAGHRYGPMWVDVSGRGALGFAWRQAHSEAPAGLQGTSVSDREKTPWLIVRSEFEQTWPMTGRLKRLTKTITQGSKRVQVFDSRTEYKSVTLPDGVSVIPVETVNTVTAKELNGEDLPERVKTTQYNTYAQPVLTRTVTTDSIRNEEFLTETQVSYQNRVDEWLLGLAISTTVTHHAPNVSPQSIQTTKRYNNKGFVRETSVNPGDALHDVTQFGYDVFGNLVSTTVTANGGSGPAITSTVTVTADGRFPETATDALGNSVKTRWDTLRGTKRWIRDADGQRTSWLHDAFGRQIRETVERGPRSTDGNKDVVVMKWCSEITEATLKCPSRAVFVSTAVDNTGDTPESAYYDLFGRVIRKQSIGHRGKFVFADTKYNRFGSVKFEGRPYFPEMDDAAARAVAAATGYRTHYDSLGRPIYRSSPLHTKDQPIGVRTRYEGLRTTVVDVVGRESHTIRNARGDVISTTDSANGVTRYRYDAAGRLVETIGVDDSRVRIEYDAWGRKVATDDPDLGRWRYEYGDFGRLAHQFDAANQKTSFTYDKLGRMTQRDERGATTRWSYVERGDGANGVGKLKRVQHSGSETESYTRVHRYDEYGRPFSATTNVNGEPFTFRTTYYGETDRPLTQHYPSGLSATTRYNDFGHPVSLHTGATEHVMAYARKYAQARQFESEALELRSANRDRIKVLETILKPHEEEAAPYRDVMDKYQWAVDKVQPQLKPYLDRFEHLDDIHGEGLGLGLPLLKWFEKKIAEPTQDAQDELDRLEKKEHPTVLDPTNKEDPSRGSAREYDRLSPADKLKADAWREYYRKRRPWQAEIDKVYNRHAVALREIDKYIGMDYLEEQFEAMDKITKPYETELEKYGDAADEVERILKPYESELKEYNGIAKEIQAWVTKAETAVAEAETAFETFRKESATHWTVTSVSAAGQPLAAIVGTEPRPGAPDNRLKTIWRYDLAGKLVLSQVVRLDESNGRQVLLRQRYLYNPDGTLKSRHADVAQVDEEFTYDQLNRLTKAVLLDGPGTAAYREANSNAFDDLLTTHFEYDRSGNLVDKSDVGTYSYGENGAGPHAVTSITFNNRTETLSYDANGNMTAGRARTIAWTPFNKPKTIRGGGVTTAMTYGPERQLVKTVKTRAGEADVAIHLGSLSLHRTRDVDGAVQTRYRHHLGLGRQPVVVVETDSNGNTKKTRYLHRDHLNSLVATSNVQGQITERLFYDAFGKPRNGLGIQNQGAQRLISRATVRGYTDHIMLDGTGLIHMGGRVYDPLLARFLSADPHVQFPYYSQSLNRYSYLMNNPLTATDPTGFFLKKLFNYLFKLFDKITRVIMKVMSKVMRFLSKYGKQIAAIALLVYAPKLGLKLLANVSGMAVGITGAGLGTVALTTKGLYASYAIAGGLAGLVTTGSLKGLLVGAISAVGFAFAGTLKGAAQFLAHGVVGGARAHAFGGSFSKAFASSILGKATHAPIAKLGIPVEGKVALAGVVGGSMSSLFGGRFRHGFWSGAFAYALNQAGQVKARVRKLVNLLTHEDHGGHALAQHVGKSEAYLRNSMRGKSYGRHATWYKKAHGTFPSLDAANRLVNTVIGDYEEVIAAYLASGEQRGLVLEGRNFPKPTGEIAYREGLTGLNTKVRPLQFIGGHSLDVIIRPYDGLPEGFLIITAYPTTEFLRQ